MKKHNLLVAIVAVVECIAFTAQPVQAAKYSKSEAKQVKYFQRKYFFTRGLESGIHFNHDGLR